MPDPLEQDRNPKRDRHGTQLDVAEEAEGASGEEETRESGRSEDISRKGLPGGSDGRS